MITCCVDADQGWAWWNEIHTKTFDELYDIGGEQFERADLLAAWAFAAIFTSELGVSLTNLTIDYATPNMDGTPGRPIRGRQLVNKIVEYNKQDERKTDMYRIQDIMK